MTIEDKLVTVGVFMSSPEAEVAKIQLEAEGIEAIVVLSHGIAYSGCRAQLQVFERDAQMAALIIAAAE